MKSLLLLLLKVSCAWKGEWTMDEITEMNHWVTFKSWSSRFGRNYSSLEEESMRFSVWLDNLYLIGRTNSQNLSYKLALNNFGDMKAEEFESFVHGQSEHHTNSNIIDSLPTILFEGLSESTASEIDWTQKGVVTPVVQQGVWCHSCWAIAATGALECNFAIKSGNKSTILSIQQLIDCAKDAGNCTGGDPGMAMQYTSQNKGLCSAETYPYTAGFLGVSGKCNADSCGERYDSNNGYKMVKRHSSSALKEALNDGCVAVGVAASGMNFQFYSSGVFTGECSDTPDHGMLAVGYGEDKESGMKYWKLKNCWDTDWGEDGYMRLCRDCDKDSKKGHCGVLQYGTVPTF